MPVRIIYNLGVASRLSTETQPIPVLPEGEFGYIVIVFCQLEPMLLCNVFPSSQSSADIWIKEIDEVEL